MAPCSAFPRPTPARSACPAGRCGSAPPPTPTFLTAANLVNVARQISLNGILAVGVTFVLLTGGVDLSLGSVVVLAARITTGQPNAGVAYELDAIAAVVIGGTSLSGGVGVTLIVNDAQRSPEKQVAQVESFIAQGVDAIVLNPCEMEASSPAVDKALAAGIPIVNVNSETRSAPTAFVGSHDEESARLAMEYIARRLGGKGAVVMMHGYMGQAAQLKRDAGAREVLARHPNLHLLAEQTAEWDRAKAVSLMENWLQRYADRIDAVFAQNDEMAMGALLAIERAKKKEKIIVVGVDAIADALEAIKQSRLDATVFQDARKQGEQAVETVLKITRKEPFARETYIPFRLITKENVGQYVQ